MEVSYDPVKLRVNSYFIKTKSGHTPNYATLLKLANMSKYDKRLRIAPIASVSSPQQFTKAMGAKLTPAAPTPLN